MENLRYSINWDALAITLAFCSLVVAVIAWFARKAGRPVRDVLALVATALVLILVLMPIVVAFDGDFASPEVKWFFHQMEFLAVTLIAYLLWWAGNKFSHRARARSARKSSTHPNL